MSTITIATRQLVGLLSDLLLTASTDPERPEVMGVLLHTAAGEFIPDLPPSDETPLIDAIEMDLLVGTSTDMLRVIAQAHAPRDAGNLAGWLRPVFIADSDATAVVTEFKKRQGRLGKEVTHKCELNLSGDVLTVREDPTQVPGGLKISFQVGDGATFPTVADRMRPDPTIQETGWDGEIIPPSYGTGLRQPYVEAFAKVSKRRVMPIAMYCHHQSAPIVVEIGSSYRAVMRPCKLDEESGQHQAPTVRVFEPPRREQKLDAVSDD